MKTKHGIQYLILGWLLAVTVEFFLLPTDFRELGGVEGLSRMSLPRVAGVTLASALLAYAADRAGVPAKIQRLPLLGCFGALAFAALTASFTWAFLGACALVFILLAVYCALGWDSRPEKTLREERTDQVSVLITSAMSVLFFLFVCGWTVGRYYSFSTPSYDFGIFSQMFYYMKKTGQPMTTLERDGLLSHFAVHVSPIYYLMLPFYWLAPTPATLQILQAAVLASAVIPLWKIGKIHGLTGPQRMLVCAVLLLYPAFSGGTGYDLHENCFLAPILLWLFYGIDSGRNGITAVAAVLCLGVKEDAAVYVAVVALWLIVKTVVRGREAGYRKLITGILLLTGSLVWFLLVTGYLARSGDGVMTYRYRNFMYDGSSSLLTVVIASIMNPMKVLYECVDGEKLPFIALTMLPLLGLPLITRRYERYILLIPYILVNLMSDYQYQHDIFFQYTFGSAACLMYLTVINLADLGDVRLLPLIGAVLISAAFFGSVVIPKAAPYFIRCAVYHDEYMDIREALDQIPPTASVSAATFYTAYLSQREILYDVRYASQEHILETDYIVLSLSDKEEYQQYSDSCGENGWENFTALLTKSGYTPYLTVRDNLVIYRKGRFNHY